MRPRFGLFWQVSPIFWGKCTILAGERCFSNKDTFIHPRTCSCGSTAPRMFYIISVPNLFAAVFWSVSAESRDHLASISAAYLQHLCSIFAASFFNASPPNMLRDAAEILQGCWRDARENRCKKMRPPNFDRFIWCYLVYGKRWMQFKWWTSTACSSEIRDVLWCSPTNGELPSKSMLQRRCTLLQNSFAPNEFCRGKSRIHGTGTWTPLLFCHYQTPDKIICENYFSQTTTFKIGVLEKSRNKRTNFRFSGSNPWKIKIQIILAISDIAILVQILTLSRFWPSAINSMCANISILVRYPSPQMWILKSHILLVHRQLCGRFAALRIGKRNRKQQKGTFLAHLFLDFSIITWHRTKHSVRTRSLTNPIPVNDTPLPECIDIFRAF